MIKRLMLSRVLVCALGVGSTLGASMLVAGGAGPAAVRLPTLAGPSYAHDVTGFRPVTRRLITDLGRAPSRPSGVRAVPVANARPATGGGPGPAAGQGGTPVPGPAPAPAPQPQPPEPPPVLTVGLTSDASRTHPNGVVTYTIRVANIGDGIARGVVVQSHVPDGTHLEGWICDGETHDAPDGETSAACGGAETTPSHPIAFAFPRLEPRAEVSVVFWVRVDKGVRHDTAIVEHAHCYATNADLIDADEIVVVV